MFQAQITDKKLQIRYKNNAKSFLFHQKVLQFVKCFFIFGKKTIVQMSVFLYHNHTPEFIQTPVTIL